MGFIERTYQSTLGFINNIGQTAYVDLASELGFAAQTVSVILIILVLINMGTQTRAMDASTSIWLIVKLTLVALFMQNWTQFNAVFLAFDQMFELLGQRMLAVSLGGTDGPQSFPAALDQLSFKTSAFANVTAGKLNILGSFMNGFMVMLIGALGAFATLALIISKIVLAVLIGIAPLAIVASLTSATKSFFESWFSAVIMMFIYPLILSGIFATVLAMGNSTISTLDANDAITMGSIIPVVMVVMLSIFMVILSPLILSLLSGSLQIGSIAGVVGGALSQPAKGALGMGTAAGAGVVNGLTGYQGKGLGGGAAGQALGKGALGMGADTASFLRPSKVGKNLGEAVNLRASQLNRVSERVERFRKK